MNILGIETSCDETAAAVVSDGRWVHSNIVATSLKEHQRFGGIIPEIASRYQLELIYDIIGKALKDAKMSFKDIHAISVTRKPGLIGSLLVGVSFARALSYSLKKPLVEVDHIQAHLYANFLRPINAPGPVPKLPAIGLVVSGGHTSLFMIRDFKSLKLLGQTRDDAAGEAFDKVARLLNLGYPGGPVIDKLAQQGENQDIHFPKSHMKGTLDFSFSGLKTAVLYYVQKHQHAADFSIPKVVYAFQESVVGVLTDKCLESCRKAKIKTLLVGGGVAANSALRKHLVAQAKLEGIEVAFPPMPLCVDNAAMIAGVGYHMLN